MASSLTITDETGTPIEVEVERHDDGTQTIRFGSIFALIRVELEQAEALAASLSRMVVRETWAEDGRSCSRGVPEPPRCHACGGHMDPRPSSTPGFEEWECEDCEEIPDADDEPCLTCDAPRSGAPGEGCLSPLGHAIHVYRDAQNLDDLS